MIRARSVISLVALLVVGGCGDPLPPATVLEASPSITKAELAGANLWILVDLKNAANGAAYVFDAALVSERIGLAVKDGAAGPSKATQWVQVQFTVPSVNGLGQDSRGRMMGLRFPIKDLRRANYANLSTYDILDLADEVRVSPLGHEAIFAYCAKSGRYREAFCRLAGAEPMQRLLPN